MHCCFPFGVLGLSKSELVYTNPALSFTTPFKRRRCYKLACVSSCGLHLFHTARLFEQWKPSVMLLLADGIFRAGTCRTTPPTLFVTVRRIVPAMPLQLERPQYFSAPDFFHLHLLLQPRLCSRARNPSRNPTSFVSLPASTLLGKMIRGRRTDPQLTDLVFLFFVLFRRPVSSPLSLFLTRQVCDICVRGWKPQVARKIERWRHHRACNGECALPL